MTITEFHNIYAERMGVPYTVGNTKNVEYAIRFKTIFVNLINPASMTMGNPAPGKERGNFGENI